MDYKMQIKQEEKLAITESMQQSMSILQMSSYELREYIEKEYEENPVLEWDFDMSEYKDGEKYLKFYKDKITFNDKSEEISPFSFISQERSLKDFLYEQLAGVKVTFKINKTVKYMIEDLDEKGYLCEGLTSICKKLKIDNKIGQTSLELLQSFEPKGIGARNLRECLLIQIKKLNKLDKNIKYIINNYLEYIGENKLRYIAKNLKLDIKKVSEYSEIIKSLEPKPSRGFYTGDSMKYIVPDAFVHKIEDKYVVCMNEEIIPKLMLNDEYINAILKKHSEKDEKYIKEKIEKAISLIKNINFRKTILLEVLEVIVENQQDYFEKGEEWIKPLTLNEVAERLGVHESTVSRAVKDKYIMTSYGTVRIKDLFGKNKYKNINKNNISSQSIKMKIKILINNEDKFNPLSDAKICEVLEKNNLHISRRTVAKYREEMGIQSSSKRKIN